MLELVAEGVGVALVSTSFAELAGPGLRAIPLARPALHHSVTLAWSRERRALPALDAFLDLAGEWLPLAPAAPRPAPK